jgi:hypothetical protein
MLRSTRTRAPVRGFVVLHVRDGHETLGPSQLKQRAVRDHSEVPAAQRLTPLGPVTRPLSPLLALLH